MIIMVILTETGDKIVNRFSLSLVDGTLHIIKIMSKDGNISYKYSFLRKYRFDDNFTSIKEDIMKVYNEGIKLEKMEVLALQRLMS